MEQLHVKVRQAAIDRLRYIRETAIWHKSWLIAGNLGTSYHKVHDWWTDNRFDFFARCDGHEIKIHISNGKWQGFTVVISCDGKQVFYASEADQPRDLLVRRDDNTDVYPEEKKIKIQRTYEEVIPEIEGSEVFAAIVKALREQNPTHWITINEYEPGLWEYLLEYDKMLEAKVFTQAEDLVKREEEERFEQLAKPLTSSDRQIAKSLGLEI